MRLRRAVADDVDELVTMQETAAIPALGHIFPQETHPFPRAEIIQRWTAEIADPGTNVYVATDDAANITGFAATRGNELLHFGTALQTWGTGLAAELHDAVLAMLDGSTDVLRLWVFEENRRACRFYEKQAWRPTGERTVSSYPPYPVLLEYTRWI